MTNKGDPTSDVARMGEAADENRAKLERQAREGLAKAIEKSRDQKSEPGSEATEPSPE